MVQLSTLFESERAQQMEVNQVTKLLGDDYEPGEVKWCLEKMMEENKIFIADDIIFLV